MRDLSRGLARTSVVLRVPVAKLDGVVRELKNLGTVQTAETRSEDVTAQRVDLDARIKALQTSVDRLLAIMRDAKDPDALIKAEDALSERQAELDSLRAQRDQLGDRIDYSTVNVTFVAEQIGGPAPQQYEGFTGQIERGWDALVSVLGNLVLLFGLLLPWLGVLAVAGGIVYGVDPLGAGASFIAVRSVPDRRKAPKRRVFGGLSVCSRLGGAADASLEQQFALGLGQAAPDAVGLADGKRVRAALCDHRAARGTSPWRASRAARGPGHARRRDGRTSTESTPRQRPGHLPIPDVGVGSG